MWANLLVVIFKWGKIWWYNFFWTSPFPPVSHASHCRPLSITVTDNHSQCKSLTVLVRFVTVVSDMWERSAPSSHTGTRSLWRELRLEVMGITRLNSEWGRIFLLMKRACHSNCSAFCRLCCADMKLMSGIQKNLSVQKKKKKGYFHKALNYLIKSAGYVMLKMLHNNCRKTL